jgi:hypothetical protein
MTTVLQRNHKYYDPIEQCTEYRQLVDQELTLDTQMENAGRISSFTQTCHTQSTLLGAIGNPASSESRFHKANTVKPSVLKAETNQMSV